MSHAKYLNRWRMLKIQFRAELSWTPPFSIFAILPCAPPGTPLITSPNSLGCCVSSPHIPSKPPHTAYHPISVTRPTFFGTGIEHVFVSGYCKCKWDCPVAQEWPSRCLETAWGRFGGELSSSANYPCRITYQPTRQTCLCSFPKPASTGLVDRTCKQSRQVAHTSIGKGVKEVEVRCWNGHIT